MLIPEVISFLSRKAQVEASSQGLLAEKMYSSDTEYSQRFPKDMTGLHLAVYFGVEAVVQLLLAMRQVDTDSKDENSRTPLSYAAESGHEAVVRLMLDNGVDISIENRSGRTALQLAALNSHHGIEQLLVIRGAPEPEGFLDFKNCFYKVACKSCFLTRISTPPNHQVHVISRRLCSS